MNNNITLEEIHQIIQKADISISTDLTIDYQTEKKITERKMEIFGVLLAYINKTAFQEIDAIDELLFSSIEERTHDLFLNFGRAFHLYYNPKSEEHVTNIFINAIKKNTYSSEELKGYLSDFFGGFISSLFIDCSNEFLNTNPLEITDFVSANYREVQGIHFDFNKDVKTIIKSDGYYKFAILKNACLPYVFSAYAIICLKKIQKKLSVVPTNIVSEIGNDIWDCVLANSPNYSNRYDEYLKSLNDDIYSIYSINHAINLMRLNDIEFNS